MILYLTFIVNLVFFCINLNTVVGCDSIGSQLIGPEENKEIVRRIIEKAGPNADVRFLTSALNGNEAMLMIFRGMLIDKRLNDSFFREIIELAEKDTCNYVDGRYANILDEEQFRMHARSLAEAYKDSTRKTLNIRKTNNLPPIRFDDENLRDILMERIKKGNNIQG